jgi:hypothetical protein
MFWRPGQAIVTRSAKIFFPRPDLRPPSPKPNEEKVRASDPFQEYWDMMGVRGPNTRVVYEISMHQDEDPAEVGKFFRSIRTIEAPGLQWKGGRKTLQPIPNAEGLPEGAPTSYLLLQVTAEILSFSISIYGDIEDRIAALPNCKSVRIFSSEMLTEHPMIKAIGSKKPTFLDDLTPEELAEYAPIPFAKLLCTCHDCVKRREAIDKEERAASQAREEAAKRQRRGEA